MMKLLPVVIITSAFLNFSLLAKGLDDLQPNERPEPGDIKSNPTPTGAQKAPSTNASTATGSVKAASDGEKQAAEPPGAVSKALSERLHFSASYGWVRIPKAEVGTFSAQGIADFMILWNFLKGSGRNYKILGTLRYAPIHSENEIEGQSYKSIIEGYHIGSQYRYRFMHKDLDLIASAEVGYLLVYQESRDKYPVQDDSEKNELAYTVGTGFEWVLIEKVSIGPRLYASFGNIQVVQFAGSATFTF